MSQHFLSDVFSPEAKKQRLYKWSYLHKSFEKNGISGRTEKCKQLLAKELKIFEDFQFLSGGIHVFDSKIRRFRKLSESSSPDPRSRGNPAFKEQKWCRSG